MWVYLYMSSLNRTNSLSSSDVSHNSYSYLLIIWIDDNREWLIIIDSIIGVYPIYDSESISDSQCHSNHHN